jgi:uncharacterized protein (UPF0332 family)
MSATDTSTDATTQLRRSFASLAAARVLLRLDPPAYGDAVSRAAAAALHAARALVGSQWARDSQPGWDPDWRPGMPRSRRTLKDRSGAAPDELHRLLERFDRLAANARLPEDFTQYVRTLVEDGQDADSGESPDYDADEARQAVGTATRMVATVAGQLEMAVEFQALEAGWPTLFGDDDELEVTDPAGLGPLSGAARVGGVRES